MFYIITEFFERLFLTNNRGSRDDVKKRLKLILAHDRSTLNASTLEKLRKEILLVVSKYVELDTDSLEFSIKTDSRMTALIANLPIRKIIPLEENIPSS
jgi:cell division topological specificity factor